MDPSDKTCKRLQQDPNWRRLKTTTSCLCDHFMCFHFCLVPFFSLYVSVVILCLFLVAWYLVVVIYSLCICFASLMVILRLFVDRYMSFCGGFVCLCRHLVSLFGKFIFLCFFFFFFSTILCLCGHFASLCYCIMSLCGSFMSLCSCFKFLYLFCLPTLTFYISLWSLHVSLWLFCVSLWSFSIFLLLYYVSLWWFCVSL